MGTGPSKKECKIYSKTYKGNYDASKGGWTNGQDTFKDGKGKTHYCGHYRYYTGCDNQWCSEINNLGLGPSACKDGVTSFKCGKDARVHLLCKDGTKVVSQYGENDRDTNGKKKCGKMMAWWVETR